jgi:hypothetical protein
MKKFLLELGSPSWRSKKTLGKNLGKKNRFLLLEKFPVLVMINLGPGSGSGIDECGVYLI